MPRHRLLALLLVLLALPGTLLAQGSGIAPDGSKGRLHVVREGDTLWDITATYLGTPWIWPSIWKENQDIRNPHLIYPGDLIWITEGEMRKVTPEEAADLLEQEAPAAEIEVQEIPLAAAPVAEPESVEPPDPFASLDTGSTAIERKLYYPGLIRFGFVSSDEYEASGSVLGSHDEQYWSAQGQRTIVSIGEVAAHIGDSFTVYRVRKRVRHPRTLESLGYFVQILGRAEITEIHAESSYAKLLVSYGEIEPGDRLRPYEELPDTFTKMHSDESVSGHIIALQPYRQYAGEGDVVLLNRGAEDGLIAGRELMVFRPGKEVRDPVSTVKLMVPDDVLGRIFVVRAAEKTSVALIRQAFREIRSGESFRSP